MNNGSHIMRKHIMDKSLDQNLKQYFGFSTFKKGQKEVIEKVLDGKSAAAIFPTGSGKSLCYQLPALMLPHLTLVVSPLISLMKDQVDFLQSHNIPAAKLDSTLTWEEYKNTVQKAKNSTLKILMISVEKFKNERFRSHLAQMNISLMVVDEAHCISEWGHNFRPEYLKLPLYVTEFRIPQLLLLTATATDEVIDDMCQKLSLTRDNVVSTGFYRPNLFLQVSPTCQEEKNQKLLERIKEYPDAPTIVYVTLQKTAENTANMLAENNIVVAPYHAGMKHEEREQVQNDFMNNKISCVVATIAFGMGLDKKNIRRIIHYDLPKSIEGYSQEIGRAGRDGEDSFCEVLANKDNINVLENFIYGDTPTKDSIRKLLEIIKHHNSNTIDIKLYHLSQELNVRQLPLKTLIVYLSIEKIITPKTVRFAEYKMKISEGETEQSISGRFKAEREQFVKALFQYSKKQRIWYTVNIDDIINNHQGADRQRIINALEYFTEKGWTELQGNQTIEIFDISTHNFDINKVTDKIHDLFIHKETNEVNRIHNMTRFFESNTCLSYKLAEYFGEHFMGASCHHCSVCDGNVATLETTSHLKPIDTFDLKQIKETLHENLGDDYTDLNLTKFLCGIHTPIFTKCKTRQLNGFALLESYPFKQVQAAISTLEQ
jgi:ATP-dependent DNA helicase RecQ